MSTALQVCISYLMSNRISIFTVLILVAVVCLSHMPVYSQPTDSYVALDTFIGNSVKICCSYQPEVEQASWHHIEIGRDDLPSNPVIMGTGYICRDEEKTPPSDNLVLVRKGGDYSCCLIIRKLAQSDKGKYMCYANHMLRTLLELRVHSRNSDDTSENNERESDKVHSNQVQYDTSTKYDATRNNRNVRELTSIYSGKPVNSQQTSEYLGSGISTSTQAQNELDIGNSHTIFLFATVACLICVLIMTSLIIVIIVRRLRYTIQSGRHQLESKLTLELNNGQFATNADKHSDCSVLVMQDEVLGKESSSMQLNENLANGRRNSQVVVNNLYYPKKENKKLLKVKKQTNHKPMNTDTNAFKNTCKESNENFKNGYKEALYMAPLIQ